MSSSMSVHKEEAGKWIPASYDEIAKRTPGTYKITLYDYNFRGDCWWWESKIIQIANREGNDGTQAMPDEVCR